MSTSKQTQQEQHLCRARKVKIIGSGWFGFVFWFVLFVLAYLGGFCLRYEEASNAVAERDAGASRRTGHVDENVGNERFASSFAIAHRFGRSRRHSQNQGFFHSHMMISFGCVKEFCFTVGRDHRTELRHETCCDSFGVEIAHFFPFRVSVFTFWCF
jgi:hypothetical protein